MLKKHFIKLWLRCLNCCFILIDKRNASDVFTTFNEPNVNLVFLFVFRVGAIHVDKPMSYINFFDEIVTDNVSSNFTEQGLPTTSAPFNKSAVNEKHEKLNLSSNFSISPHENLTTNFEPHESIVDVLFRAEDTHLSKESNFEVYTITPKYKEMDVEGEMNRLFFLRAIADLVQHIMMTLFSVEDRPQVSMDTDIHDDYDCTSSRNLDKRELSNVDDQKVMNSDNDSNANKSESTTTEKGTLSYVTEGNKTTTNNSHLFIGKNSSNLLITSSFTNVSEPIKIHDQLLENRTEHKFDVLPAILEYNHNFSSHQSNHDTSSDKTLKSENEKTPTKGVKQDKFKVLPERGTTHNVGALVNLPIQLNPIDDNVNVFHLNEKSSLLNDDVAHKKETHFYGDVIPAEHNGFKEHLSNTEDENSSQSTSLLVTMLVCTSSLLVLLFGTLALASYYFYRKVQAQVSNQTATNSHPAVA